MTAAPEQSEPAGASVSVRNVTRRFGRGRTATLAVDDVSFELASGSLTALVGPSGAGKTTLLNLVLGTDAPDEGTVSGVPLRPTWAELAVVPQSLGLLGELSIAENVEFPVRLGNTAREPIDTVLARLGLADLADRPPDETSLGQQQRAAVARAIIVGPQLLIADEPTSHQDEANTDRVADALEELALAGTCVLLATHDRRVVERCTHVLEMIDGRLERLR